LKAAPSPPLVSLSDADIGGAECAPAAARAHEVIRIDAAWFAVEPLDMRAGVDKALARVVNVSAKRVLITPYSHQQTREPHERCFCMMASAYGCARESSTKAAFIRAGVRHDRGMPLSHEQLQAMVVDCRGSGSMSARRSVYSEKKAPRRLLM